MSKIKSINEVIDIDKENDKKEQLLEIINIEEESSELERLQESIFDSECESCKIN